MTDKTAANNKALADLRVNGDRLWSRLMDMGITRGVEITPVKASPLGDPVEYRLRGYNLSLRKSEAQMIEVAL